MLGRTTSLLLAITLFAAPALAGEPARGGPAVAPADISAPTGDWGLLVFGGEMSANDFGETLNPTVDRNRKDVNFIGAALSRRVHDGRFIDLELEGGGGYQFSDSKTVFINGQALDDDSGQVWAAIYARYDVFPWNHFIHTTVAISTGVNYSFEKTAHEEAEDHDDGTRKLLHYLSPEITIAHPRHKDWEGVLRLHHRSGVFGGLGCNKCGSNMVTFGVRKRF